MARVSRRGSLLAIGLVACLFAGCGSTVIPSRAPESPLAGNWLVVGSLAGLAPGALGTTAPGFNLALNLQVNGSQITANLSDSYNCVNAGGAAGGRVGITQIAADGTFTLQSPGQLSTITFQLQGVAPQKAGETWSGTYTANDTNPGCSPSSGTFTAVPIQPVTGIFTGKGPLGSVGSSGSPITLTATLKQGGAVPDSPPTNGEINSQNVLSGSLAVQGTPCFTSGTIGATSLVLGSMIHARVAMNDGSTVVLSGYIEDAATTRIGPVGFLVEGGQCDKLFITGDTILARQ